MINTTPPQPGFKVAVIGFGDGWREGLKRKAEGFEIWGFNDMREGFERDHADRWFQIHSREYLRDKWKLWLSAEYFWAEYWKEGGAVPLYTQEHYPDMVGSIAFPKKEIEAMPFGSHHCGSFDWLIACAILWQASEIHVYGVGLSYNGEPLSARACLEFWLGVAVGKGIKVHVVSADLFYTFNLVRSHWQYGWDESRPIIPADELPALGDS